MKKIFKNLIFFLLGLFSSGLKKQASILMYHSIGDNKTFYTVKPETFARQLDYLKDKKIKAIKLSELAGKIRRKENIGGCVCLTFDDGYLDNFINAFPLLKKHNFPATIFLATDFIGRTMTNSQGVTLPMLSVEQIKEMAASGLIEFMPHTTSHCHLKQATPEKIAAELTASRAKVRELADGQADILAYPWGEFDDRTVDFLKQNNWQAAVTVVEGLVDENSDLFHLERNSIDSSTDLAQFKGKTSEIIGNYAKIKKWLRV